MNRVLLPIGALAFILLSCSSKPLNREELIDEITEMYYADQKYRRILGIIRNSHQCEEDSITFFSRSSKAIQLVESTIYDDIIIRQDSINTEKLLKITQEYGFPGMTFFDHDVPVFMVFVHSDQKYFKTIKKIIDKEYKLDHLSKYEYDYINWHLNGRDGMKPISSSPINYRNDEDIINGIEIKNYN